MLNSLGSLLRELRGKRSLREAAKLSGLSYSYISSLEKGEHPKTKAPIIASPESLKQLAKAYRYDYKELYRICGIIDDEDKKEGFLTDPQKLKLLELINGLDTEDTTHVTDYVEYWIQKKK